MNNDSLFHPALDCMDVTRLHQYLGAVPVSADATRFCVWAPQQQHINIVDEATGLCHTLEPLAGGYHCGIVQGLTSGARYRVQLENKYSYPDPVSRYQPDGVHGPSAIVSSHYPWTDQSWAGVARDELVIYELHIGTFTREGDYAGAIERLDELVALGITAIELMPLNQSAGRWNWGYDGVNWFAPQNSYGTADDLRCFVDTAHRKGLAVILDVVYNHFGPEGNYLPELGSYISDHHHSAWGPSPNLDRGDESQQLRRLMIANVIYWLDEYHMDGVRVDAIHCISDDSSIHWVGEMAEATRRWGREHNRNPLLIAESNVFDPQMLQSARQGGFGFDALWSDCFLQSLFAVVRPTDQLSERRYESADLQCVLSQGYVFEGSIGSERNRTLRDDRPDLTGLIYSIQHHDCIGNHPLGKRLHQLTDIATQRAAAALMLLLPATPMLFMGEEFSSESPFNFFVDFADEGLRESVEKGRQSEYPQHDWSGGVSPLDPKAMIRSRIGAIDDGNRDTWNWYQRLIALRKTLRKQGLLDCGGFEAQCDLQQGVYQISYQSGRQKVLVVVRLTNIMDTAESVVQFVPFGNLPGTLELDSGSETTRLQELLPNHAKVFVEPLGD